MPADDTKLVRVHANVSGATGRGGRARANDALRRHGPVAELLGSSVPAWPELNARLDGWLDAVRAAGVKV